MVNISNFFARSMVKLTEMRGATAFENTFQQLQKTVINRTNDKIEKLNGEYNAGSREGDALARKARTLQAEIPVINRYISENQSNYNRLEDIITKITELQNAFGTDGNTADVTATDITEFDALRDELATQVNNLHYLTHPDLVKPYAVTNMKDKLASIQQLTPAVGSVNDATNAAITTFLADLSEEAVNAMAATYTTIGMGNKLSLSYQAKLVDIETTLVDKDEAKKAQLNQDIENLKIDAANFLQAISLSYESQSYTSNYLSNALASGIQPPKNSILNIFS